MDELMEIKNQLRDNISEREFWESRSVEVYFTDIAKAILERYGSDFQMTVRVKYKKSDDIAYTSFDSIVLNAGCKQVMKIANMHHKLLYLKGLLAHELSHVIYMDKRYMDGYYKKMQRGIILPRIPSMNGKEKGFVEAVRDTRKAGILLGIIKYIQNSLEDGYGENTYLANYYGSLVDGMKYMRKEFFKDLSMTSEIEKKLAKDDPKEKLNGVMDIILVYALYHRLRGDGDYPLSKKVLEEISDIIDKIFECDFKERTHCVNMLIVKLWDYIEPVINVPEQDQKNQPSNGKNKSPDGGSESDGNGDGAGGFKPPASGKPVHGNGPLTVPLTNQQEHADPKPSEFEDTSKDDGDGDSLLERVLDELSRKALEEKRLCYLNNEMNQGRTCGCKVQIFRDSTVTTNMIQKYNKYEEVLEVSRRIQKTIKQQLEDRRKGGKRNGLYMGRKIEVRQVIRNDGKCFYNNVLPSNTPRICVSVILDESTSMLRCDNKNKSRISYATEVAVVVEDFCRQLDFPVSIVGSTADWNGNIGVAQLTVYSSFDSADGNDKYRLMNIQAKGCNRDGASYSFALQQLMKRTEEVKILFIISDGKPNAFGYGGIQAESEIKMLNEKAKKAGIVVFAAAIGEDKKQIENIYGDSFLDITDLDAMPKMFIDRIKTFIKR